MEKQLADIRMRLQEKTELLSAVEAKEQSHVAMISTLEKKIDDQQVYSFIYVFVIIFFSAPF